MKSFPFKTALLIDDDEINNIIHSKIIESVSLAQHVVFKNSALEALEFLIHNIPFPENIPDIIFLDINMPVMNGFEFLEELSKLPSFIWEKAKIVMLSSTIHKEEIEKLKANRYVDRFICKPLTCQDLIKLL
jgi:CheY-like chemotaxis protein